MDTMMNQKLVSTSSIFSFIKPSHSFYKQIKAFEKLIQESPAHSAFLSRQDQGLATSIHAEIKTKCDDEGRHIERFYYSIQYPEKTLPGGLYGWSLHYARSEGIPKIYEFPNDPKLPHLQTFIDSPDNRDVEVLRYVPLRRVTFRKAASERQPVCIGKLKKPNRCLEGYRRLTDISKIAKKSVCTIPGPLVLNSSQSVFYQEFVPGMETGLILNRENYRNFLTEIGKLHGEVQMWPIPVDKPWDRDGVMANLRQDLEEIMFYLPQTETILLKIGKWLKQRENSLRVIPQTFCHGDFACSQILHHADGWSVVDFDLAGLGNPYQDMAMFLVSLYSDVDFFQTHPDLLPSAYAAFLQGYQIVNGEGVDFDTFNWYLVCAEIYYLALTLKKDRFTASGLERASARLQELTNLS